MDDGAPEVLACRCRFYLGFFGPINQVVGMLGGIGGGGRVVHAGAAMVRMLR